MMDFYMNVVVGTRGMIESGMRLMSQDETVLGVDDDDVDALRMLERMLVVHRHDQLSVLGNLNDLIFWSTVRQVPKLNKTAYAPLYKSDKHLRPEYFCKRFGWSYAKVHLTALLAVWWSFYFAKLTEGMAPLMGEDEEE